MLQAVVAEVEGCWLKPEEVLGEPEDAFTPSMVEALRRDDAAAMPVCSSRLTGFQRSRNLSARTVFDLGSKLMGMPSGDALRPRRMRGHAGVLESAIPVAE
jgi:hypothetical protein